MLRLQRQLRLKVTRLDTPVLVTDYTGGGPKERVELKSRATLYVDGGTFPRQRFLVATTGYDLIVGQHWLAGRQVALRPWKKTILWPDSLLPTDQFQKSLDMSNYRDSPFHPKHQGDAERRDAAMSAEVKREVMKRLKPSSANPSLASLYD